MGCITSTPRLSICNRPIPKKSCFRETDRLFGSHGRCWKVAHLVVSTLSFGPRSTRLVSDLHLPKIFMEKRHFSNNNKNIVRIANAVQVREALLEMLFFGGACQDGLEHFFSTFACLTEGGGGQRLFGQCLYGNNTFQNRPSLTL